MKQIKLIILGLFTSFFTYSQSSFFYNNGISCGGLEPGRGFEFADPTAAKMPFLKNVTLKKELGSGKVDVSEMEISCIKTYEDLISKCNVNFNVKIKSPSFKLQADAGSNFSMSSEENSFTFYIKCKTSYGKYFLSDSSYTLKEDAKNLAKTNCDKFIQRYGDYYVSAVERGNGFYAYFTITGLSKSTVQALYASMDGKYTAAAVSAQVKASLTQEIKKSSSENRLLIKIKSMGSKNGFEDLTELIKLSSSGEDAYQAIINTISTYVKENFKESEAKNITYFYAPITEVLDECNKKIDYSLPDIKVTNLLKWKAKILQIYDLTEECEKVMQNENYKSCTSANEKNAVLKYNGDLQKVKEELENKYKLCANCTTCKEYVSGDSCKYSLILLPDGQTLNNIKRKLIYTYGINLQSRTYENYDQDGLSTAFDFNDTIPLCWAGKKLKLKFSIVGMECSIEPACKNFGLKYDVYFNGQSVFNKQAEVGGGNKFSTGPLETTVDVPMNGIIRVYMKHKTWDCNSSVGTKRNSADSVIYEMTLADN